MDKEVSVVLAAKLVESMDKLDEALDYMKKNVEFKKRAPLTRAVGEIFAIMSEEIKSRLVIANRELHEVLFHELPEDAPERFLQMSRYRHAGDRKE